MGEGTGHEFRRRVRQTLLVGFHQVAHVGQFPVQVRGKVALPGLAQPPGEVGDEAGESHGAGRDKGLFRADGPRGGHEGAALVQHDAALAPGQGAGKRRGGKAVHNGQVMQKGARLAVAGRHGVLACVQGRLRQDAHGFLAGTDRFRKEQGAGPKLVQHLLGHWLARVVRPTEADVRIQGGQQGLARRAQARLGQFGRIFEQLLPHGRSSAWCAGSTCRPRRAAVSGRGRPWASSPRMLK